MLPYVLYLLLSNVIQVQYFFFSSLSVIFPWQHLIDSCNILHILLVTWSHTFRYELECFLLTKTVVGRRWLGWAILHPNFCKLLPPEIYVFTSDLIIDMDAAFLQPRLHFCNWSNKHT